MSFCSLMVMAIPINSTSFNGDWVRKELFLFHFNSRFKRSFRDLNLSDSSKIIYFMHDSQIKAYLFNVKEENNTKSDYVEREVGNFNKVSYKRYNLLYLLTIFDDRDLDGYCMADDIDISWKFSALKLLRIDPHGKCESVQPKSVLLQSNYAHIIVPYSETLSEVKEKEYSHILNEMNSLDNMDLIDNKEIRHSLFASLVSSVKALSYNKIKSTISFMKKNSNYDLDTPLEVHKTFDVTTGVYAPKIVNNKPTESRLFYIPPYPSKYEITYEHTPNVEASSDKSYYIKEISDMDVISMWLMQIIKDEDRMFYLSDPIINKGEPKLSIVLVIAEYSITTNKIEYYPILLNNDFLLNLTYLREKKIMIQDSKGIINLYSDNGVVFVCTYPKRHQCELLGHIAKDLDQGNNNYIIDIFTKPSLNLSIAYNTPNFKYGYRIDDNNNKCNELPILAPKMRNFKTQILEFSGLFSKKNYYLLSKLSDEHKLFVDKKDHTHGSISTVDIKEYNEERHTWVKIGINVRCKSNDQDESVLIWDPSDETVDEKPISSSLLSSFGYHSINLSKVVLFAPITSLHP